LSGAWVNTEAAKDLAVFVELFCDNTFPAKLAIFLDDFSLLAILFSYFILFIVGGKGKKYGSRHFLPFSCFSPS
jgi:hypothetical protein